ncbi:MAG: hypothetical protein ACE15B_23045 [Bryobacteraceae bacterium]
MRPLAWAFCVCALFAREPGVPAQVVGGTVAALAANPEGRLDLTGARALVFHSKNHTLRIAFDRLHTLEYGQRVSRRYTEGILISPVLLLSRSRKHYVTVGYRDDGGERQALVLRLGKSDIRGVLAALEAKSGLRVEYQDEEARLRGRD